MIGSFTIKSLEDIYHFLREVVSSESQNPASVESQDHSALAVQGRAVGGGDRGDDRSGGRARKVIY